MLIQTKRTIEAMKSCGFEHGKNKDFTVKTGFDRSIGGYKLTKVSIAYQARQRIVEQAEQLAATQDLDITIMIWETRDGEKRYHPIITEGNGKLEEIEIENLNR